MVISKDTASISRPYRGRFAPSPTGPLHEGSLLTALASCLEARVQGGEWLLRMEDLDPPREMPGAADDILRTLEAFGFAWDGELRYQSRRLEYYRAVLDALLREGRAYGCACTRKEIAEAGRMGIDGALYPGFCRNGLRAGRTPRAWRLRVEAPALLSFDDAIQGVQAQDLISQVGDFVLLRADGYFAYQLAVVVDDADQGINHIVRGADLLDSTPRQLYLQQCLGYRRPNYAHLPILTNAAGEKLSKQTLAPALDKGRVSELLWQALRRLGQSPDSCLRGASSTEIWAWARENWQLGRVPRQTKLSEPVFGAM